MPTSWIQPNTPTITITIRQYYLMSEFELLDNGFMLLRQHDAFGSPVACLHYAYYDKLEELEQHLEQEKEEIQCISTNPP